MSWSRRALLALSAAPLAGCGFRPLYGGGGAVAAEFADIAVDPVETDAVDARLGQILRNELLQRLNPAGQPRTPRYALHVTLYRSAEALGIQQDDTITRYNLTLSAHFTLTERATGALVYRAQTRSVGAYDVQVSEYATVVAEQSTAGYAARDVGERIATLLALFFRGRAG